MSKIILEPQVPKEIPTVLEKVEIRPNGSRRVYTLIGSEPSMTEQQYKDEVDVVNIVAKYQRTGDITHLARTQGVYADVSEITDLRESMDKVLAAQAAFDSLPSKVRERFANDPAAFLEFMQDEKNLDEAVELGLIERRAQEMPTQSAQKTNELNKKNSASVGSPDAKPSENKES